MILCGIVAEYNPFHNGHAYQMQKTREMLGENTAIVCAMSGNFVQRGEFALLEKYRRAEAAVRGGADLVLELPLAAALSSADGFAAGAVQTLLHAGCTALSFGCEEPDLPLLCRTAAALDAMPFRPVAGMSYAASVQAALETQDPAAAALLATPNNTLAVSYLRAAKGRFARLLPVQRTGVAHDAAETHGGFASASHIRALLHAGNHAEAAAFLPAPARAVLADAMDAGCAPVALPEHMLLAQLRLLAHRGLLTGAGTGGFAERLHAAIESGGSYADVVAAAKSKHYPEARVRRALLREALGLPARASVSPQYLRVLGMSPRGRDILRTLDAPLPRIIKPSMEKRLPQAMQDSLRRDAYADDLYHLALPNPALRAGGQHYQKTPFVGA